MTKNSGPKSSEPPKYFVTRAVAYSHTRSVRPAVIRMVKVGELWVQDEEWQDPKPKAENRREAERRAQGYASVERFEQSKREGKLVGAPVSP